MMNKTVLLTVVAVLVGAAGGYAYYHFVGCATGTCPITSNPYISTGYGALLGFVLAGSRKKQSDKS
jgi:hypothetical protein